MSGLAKFFHNIKLPANKKRRSTYDDRIQISTPPTDNENDNTNKNNTAETAIGRRDANNNTDSNSTNDSNKNHNGSIGADDEYNVSLRDVDEYANHNSAGIDINIDINADGNINYKTTRQEWKDYCYADLIHYITVRVNDEDGDNNKIDNKNERGSESYCYDKMIGEHYYDSENENDSEVHGNSNGSVNDDSDEGRNLEDNRTNDNGGDDDNQQEQLETQPIGLFFNNSQENNTIQEFTPSPVDGTDATAPNAIGGNANATIDDAAAYMHQTQESYSSLYSQSDINEDSYRLTLSRQETTKTANTKANQNDLLVNVNANDNTNTKTKSKSNNINDNNQSNNSTNKKLLPIPPISLTTDHISTISKINLQTTKTLSLPLSSVKMFWGCQNVKRVPKDYESVQIKIDQLAPSSSSPSPSFRQNQTNQFTAATTTAITATTTNESNLVRQYEHQSLEKMINEMLERDRVIYGPLFQNYRTVCSLELLELEEDYLNLDDSILTDNNNSDSNGGHHDRGGRGGHGELTNNVSGRYLTDVEKKRNKRIHESAKAVFTSIVDTDTTTANASKSKRTKKPRRRRIRVFFYNAYATQVNKFFQQMEIRRGTSKDNSISYNSKKNEFDSGNSTKVDSVSEREITKSVYPFLVSLRNVPAKCIFPYYLERSDRAGEALLENDYYGRLAPYCICIGGSGRMRFGMKIGTADEEKLSFDSNALEIRFLKLNDNDHTHEEFIIKKGTVGLDTPPLPAEVKSGMEERFKTLVNLQKKQKELELKNQQQEESGSTDDNIISDNNGAMAVNLQPRHSSSNTSGAANALTPPAGRKRKRISMPNHVYHMLVSTISTSMTITVNTFILNPKIPFS